MRVILLSFIISLICLKNFGQEKVNATIHLKEVQKTANFKIPNSILFIIKGNVEHFENLFDLTTQLKKQFKNTNIKIDSEFDFKDSEKKVVDTDIMILKNYDFDRNTFETEFLLDFTNIQLEKLLSFEFKNKEDKILIKGIFEIGDNKNNFETNELISKRILELFE